MSDHLGRHLGRVPSNECRLTGSGSSSHPASQVKQYFAAITGRRNTITGQLYRDDPTIMSWVGGSEQRSGLGAAERCSWRQRVQLAAEWCSFCCFGGQTRVSLPQNVLNEARCSFCGPEAVDSWIGEMSAYLKVAVIARSPLRSCRRAGGAWAVIRFLLCGQPHTVVCCALPLYTRLAWP